MSFYRVLLVSMFDLSGSGFSASSFLSFCQFLLLCLVKHGLGKSWLCRGPIYSGPALVFFLLLLLLSLRNNLSIHGSVDLSLTRHSPCSLFCLLVLPFSLVR